MKLEGIHHVTCITGDAPRNLDFYARVLGLRLVKKTVNQDDPTVYHLFYADDAGSPGADLTFFEYPGAREGRAGAGMVHTVVFRVGGEAALGFWEARLAAEGVATERRPGPAGGHRTGDKDPCGPVCAQNAQSARRRERSIPRPAPWVTRPSRRAHAALGGSRNSLRRILPTLLFGSSSRNSTCLGCL